MQDGPALNRCVHCEAWARVDGDRMFDGGEERDVVVRVGVEPRLGEVAVLEAARAQPVVQVDELARAVARDAVDAAGVAAVLDLGFGGDQVLDPELARDRGGDEAVRRGDDRELVALGAVVLDELARGGSDARADEFVEELFAPRVQLVPGVARERRELEVEERLDVERARVVVVVEAPHALDVHRAVAREQFAPEEIAVAREQRVVEVEEGEAHQKPR